MTRKAISTIFEGLNRLEIPLQVIIGFLIPTIMVISSEEIGTLVISILAILVLSTIFNLITDLSKAPLVATITTMAHITCLVLLIPAFYIPLENNGLREKDKFNGLGTPCIFIASLIMLIMLIMSSLSVIFEVFAKKGHCEKYEGFGGD